MAQKELVVLFTVDPKKDLEKASMGFSIAASATAVDVTVRMFFAHDGINTLVKGYLDGLAADHFTPLKELMEVIQESGGEIHICHPFMPSRGIKEEDLIEGVIISSAPTLVHSGSDSSVVTI